MYHHLGISLTACWHLRLISGIGANQFIALTFIRANDRQGRYHCVTGAFQLKAVEVNQVNRLSLQLEVHVKLNLPLDTFCSFQ